MGLSRTRVRTAAKRAASGAFRVVVAGYVQAPTVDALPHANAAVVIVGTGRPRTLFGCRTLPGRTGTTRRTGSCRGLGGWGRARIST